MRGERGFSLFKFLMLVAALAVGVWYGWLLIPVYNAEWKVEDMFESIARNMSDASEAEIRARLPELFKIKYIDRDDLPEEFYDNIEIKAENGRVEISSFYHVTIWPLGPVEEVDPESEYDPEELRGLDRVRDALRLDFDFEPHAETP